MSKTKEINKDDIAHLGQLTKLEVSSEESILYASQMNATVQYIENLQELNTDTTEPTNNGLKTENIFFNDGEPNKRILTQEETLKNARNKTGSFFVVKKIM
jgi:aspartyl-tRNA(Asn)/glutamyl-tRNA(Gln) amidotransferase subunit C